jgi:hypothetical protein
VSIGQPLAALTCSGDIIDLVASATDDVAVASVQFTVDGANVGSAVTTAPYVSVWNTTLVSNGLHTLTAIAKDLAGNTTTSTPITVTVSNPGTVQIYTLTVTKAGTGTGTVTGRDLNCGITCNAGFTNLEVATLVATPAAGSTFAGWSGNQDCSDGAVTMTVDKTCIATFTATAPVMPMVFNITGVVQVDKNGNSVFDGCAVDQCLPFNVQVAP